MSGTSLDGLDIAHVQFWFGTKWNFELIACESIAYTASWSQKLHDAIHLSGFDLKKLDIEYGMLLGEFVQSFINKNKVRPILIVSHGHTVFHQPENGLTTQIGDGNQIYAKTGINTIYDLRSLDVALGGQGAPLVPIGDRMLFGDFDFCLNLGGFSNISYEKNGERMAFDISPVNTVLNYLAQRLGQPFDRDGQLARNGKMIPKLRQNLNNLDYYQNPPPKSLGIEWVHDNIFPLLQKGDPLDLLHTFCHHVAEQIAFACNLGTPKGRLLISGGGAKNSFLTELISEKTTSNIEVTLPSVTIIDFKEAIIFAFLGLLKHLGQDNCLSSVTGASRDSSGGLVING